MCCILLLHCFNTWWTRFTYTQPCCCCVMQSLSPHLCTICGLSSAMSSWLQGLCYINLYAPLEFHKCTILWRAKLALRCIWELGSDTSHICMVASISGTCAYFVVTCIMEIIWLSLLLISVLTCLPSVNTQCSRCDGVWGKLSPNSSSDCYFAFGFVSFLCVCSAVTVSAIKPAQYYQVVNSFGRGRGSLRKNERGVDLGDQQETLVRQRGMYIL